MRLFQPRRRTPALQTKSDGLSYHVTGGATRGFAYTPATGDRLADEVKRTERSVWAYRAAMAIAHNQAALPIVVRKGSPTGNPIKGHTLVDLLNMRPNPYEDAYTFRVRLSLVALLNRRGCFVHIIRDVLGDPLELYILPPLLTKPVPDPTTFLRGALVDIAGQKTLVPVEDLIWVKYPHPTDPYDGWPPAVAAGLPLDNDWLAQLFNRSFLLNDGGKTGMVAIRGNADEDTIVEIQDRFGGGPTTAGKVTVVQADDIKAVDLSTSMRDAQHVETRKAGKEETLAAYGVPESVAGNASGRTFDNADVEQVIFWKETEVPHLRLLANALDLADGDPRTFVTFDLSSVEALQRAEHAERERALAEVKGGLRTPNQFFVLVGLPEVDEPWANLHIMHEGEPKVLEHQTAEPPPPPVMLPAPNNRDADDTVDDDDEGEGVTSSKAAPTGGPFRVVGGVGA